jgi:NADPH-dependent 2,4-dienoyl-CoA reductase/sulfur reductase-like enzyme
VHGRVMRVRVKPPMVKGEAPKVDRQSPYVIVGLGVAGKAALKSLLECEPDAHVMIIEADIALEGDSPVDGLASGGPAGLLGLKGKRAGRNVKVLWGTSVRFLDTDQKVLHLSDGTTVGFGKCLLAMGLGARGVPTKHIDGRLLNRWVLYWRVGGRRRIDPSSPVV